MRHVVAVIMMLALAGCGVAPRAAGGDILIVGDSVLAWNRTSGQDVGRVISGALARDVTSRAALGAQLDAGGLARLGGLDIAAQLSDGPWRWVVMNGGANDLAASCGCGPCADRIDQLISATGASGIIPDLIAQARRSGAQVIWAGYYEAPASRSFAGCRAGLVEVERRIARHAAATDGVIFIDTEDVLDPRLPGLLARDLTHPSPAGSALIGQFIADEIRRSGG